VTAATLLIPAAAVLAYAAACWLFPFDVCARCHGSSRWCRRCDGTGRRVRVGRRAWDYLRSLYDHR
jgi:hypothetical protein